MKTIFDLFIITKAKNPASHKSSEIEIEYS